MKALTDADLIHRKRATRIGTVMSNVSVAATVFLFLSATASVMVLGVAAILIVLWFAATICLVGLPLLNESWRALIPKLLNTVEFGGQITDFMVSLTAPLAAVSIGFAVLAPVMLLLGAGENKSKAIPRTIVSGVVVVVAIICIIFAGGVK